MTSGLPLDMLQLPSEMRGGDLRAIPEDASFRGASPMRPLSRGGGGQPPMWGNPISDFSREGGGGGGGGVEDWRSGVGPGVSRSFPTVGVVVACLCDIYSSRNSFPFPHVESVRQPGAYRHAARANGRHRVYTVDSAAGARR